MPNYDLRELKTHLSEYVESITEKRKYGKYNCPCCGSGTGSNNTPAFTMRENNTKWKCHSCGKGGSIIDLYLAVNELVSTKENISTAIRELSAMFGIVSTEIGALGWDSPIGGSKADKKQSVARSGSAPKQKAPEIGRREHIYNSTDDSHFAKKTVISRADGSKCCYWSMYSSETRNFSIKGLQGAHAPLYNAPLLLSASDYPVYFVEGEKDADRLVNWGEMATCTPNGAGQTTWFDEYTELIKGRDIFILTDNDQPGEKYGQFVASHVYGAAKSVKIIPAKAIYEECPIKGDISDIADQIGDAAAQEALAKAMELIQPYQTENNTEERFKAIVAADVEEDKTRFTWFPYLPVGDYTVLMAAGGTGKTILCCGIAAAISSGEALPQYGGRASTPEPKNVLLISAEDRAAMIRKRLEAFGADLNRCFILDCAASNGLLLPTGESDKEGNQIFRGLLSKYHPEFVFIDPWHAFLSPDVDINRVNAVRQVFHNIAVICKDHDCSMMLVSHVNKKAQGDNANNAATGSADLVNAGRSALQLVFDNTPGAEDRRILVHTKSNYAAAGKSVAFVITSDSGCEWNGFSDITRATIEEAARLRRTPSECLAIQTADAESRTTLIQAITTLAEPGKSVNVRFKKLQEDFGEDIYMNKQPAKALALVSKDLFSRGIQIVDIGKNVKSTKEDIESGQPKIGRGFAISCMETGEQMAAALPH